MPDTLSQRIAALTGPDRAVDAEVAVAMGCVPAGYAQAIYHGKGQPFWWHDTDEKAPYWSPPAFTASLDAAMSVVPEGFAWAVATTPEGEALAGLKQSDPFAAYDASAPTPALALLAAAIKARGLS